MESLRQLKEQVNLRNEGLPFNLWTIESSSMTGKHMWHEFTEILHVLKGSVYQRIGDRTYRMTQGDTAVVNGLELHSVYSEPGVDIALLVIQIPPSFISLYYRENRRYRVSSNFLKNGSAHPALDPLTRCMNEIIDEYISKKPGYRYFLTSHVYRLLGILFRHLETVDSDMDEYMEQKLNLERISPALDFIHENYRSSISLGEVSAIAGMGRQYFCKCFRKATTYTFTQYINVLRVLHSQELLLSTDSNITEAAYASGFSSVNYFNRIFRKFSGVSPSHFRRK